MILLEVLGILILKVIYLLGLLLNWYLYSRCVGLSKNNFLFSFIWPILWILVILIQVYRWAFKEE
jgi:hypothetical protein